MNPFDQFRFNLRRWRRRLAESVGVRRYSHPALNGLDRKLIERIGMGSGFFVEAGANDGFLQSNTYALERFHGWTGILIEPIPELYRRCLSERPRSVCVNAALVSRSWREPTIGMQYAGLMSLTDEAFESPDDRARHVRLAGECQRIGESYHVTVPARTLDSILSERAPGREVDLLSLDVEGAEMEALGGLDLERLAPKFVCIEARDEKAVRSFFGGRYSQPEVLFDSGTHRDLLFVRK